MSTPQTIAVTGATGFVGRAVVKALLAAGYAVRALARDRDKARQVLPADPRVAAVLGDVLDGRAPADLVAGCSACIHLIGIIRERSGGQTFRRIHVDATAAMLAACRASGTRRFVHMSALGVSPDGLAEYQRTKFDAEMLVRRSTMDWTVFRPGLIHGKDGELVGMIRDWCSASKQPYFFIPYFAREVQTFTDAILPTITLEPARVAPIAVEDVARCFVAAIGRPQAVGEVYNLVGAEDLNFRQMLEWWRDHLPHAEQTLSVVGVPARAASMQATAARLMGLGGLLPFDEGMPLMAMQDSTADLAKVRADLGVTPARFSDSALEYAPQLT